MPKHHSSERLHRIHRSTRLKLMREAEALDEESYVIPLTRSLARKGVYVCAAGCTQQVSREGEVCFLCWRGGHHPAAA